MAKTLPGGRTLINPLEGLIKGYMNDERFNMDDFNWLQDRGRTQQYLAIAENFDRLPSEQEIQQIYGHYDLMDTERRIAAQMNELFADRENKSSKTISKFNTETEQWEDVVQDMSDYEYSKYYLDQWAEFKDQESAQEAWRQSRIAEKLAYENTSWIQRLGGTLLDTFVFTPINAMGDFLSNIGQLFAGTANGFSAMAEGKDFGEAFRNSMTEGYGRIGFMDEFSNWVQEYEKNNTFYRDWQGNANGAYSAIVGTVDSLTQMLPSMLLQMGSAKALSAAGKTGKVAKFISRTSGMIPYYTSMWSGSMSEAFQNPLYNNVSTGAIVAQTALATILDATVEMISNKLLGGTWFEQKAFGAKGMSKMFTGGTLVRALKRGITEAVNEGIEEMMQEFTSMFSKYVYYWEYENIMDQEVGLQQAADAFLMGMLGSIFSGAFHYVVSKHQYIKGPDGKITRLSKLKSMDLRTHQSQLYEAYDKVIRDDSLSKEDRLNAMKELYKYGKTMVTLYEALGPDRYNKASEYLAEFEEKIMQGGKDEELSDVEKRLSAELDYQTTYINSMFVTKGEYKDYKRSNKNIDDETVDNTASEELRKIFDFKKETTKEAVKNKKVSSSTANKIEKIKEVSGKDTIVVEGKNILKSDKNTVIISEDLINNQSATAIMEADKDRELIKNLLTALPEGTIKIVNEMFEKYANLNSIKILEERDISSTEQALYHLLFNPEFFNICLYRSFEGTYEIFIKLDSILKALYKDNNTLDEKIQSHVVQKVREGMRPSIVTYLSTCKDAIHTGLEALNKDDYNQILKNRYIIDQVINVRHTPTKSELTVLRNMINSYTVDNKGNIISEDKKKSLLSGLESKDKRIVSDTVNEVREMVLDAFDYEKQGTFPATREYGDIIFSQYLRSTGNTIDTLLKMDKETRQTFFDNFNKKYPNYRIDTISGKYVVKEINKQSVDVNFEIKNNQYFAKTSEDLTLSERKAGIPEEDYIAIKKIKDSLIDKELSYLEQEYISIDDLIRDSRYLSDDVKKKIKDEYGIINSSTTISFIKDKYSKYAISRNRDGKYVLVKLEPYAKLISNTGAPEALYKAFSQNSNKGKALRIDEFAKNSSKAINKYLYKGVYISIDDVEKSNAKYDNKSNIIHISKKTYDEGLEAFTIAITHELLHHVQKLYNMAGGWNTDYKISDEALKLLYDKDFAFIKSEKYENKSYKSLSKSEKEKIERLIRAYLYRNTNEIMSEGIIDTNVPLFVTDPRENKTANRIITDFGVFTIKNDVLVVDDGKSDVFYSKSENVSIEELENDIKMSKNAESRYVSNKEAEKTNLKYFIKKGQPIIMGRALQSFIIDADLDKLAPELSEKLKNGTLKRKDILDYLYKDFDKLDDYNFTLINNSFFENEKFETKKDLELFISRIISAVSMITTFKTEKSDLWEELRSDNYSVNDVITFADNYIQTGKYTDSYIKFKDKYFYKDNISDRDFIISSLLNFDGSLSSIASIAFAVKKAHWEYVSSKGTFAYKNRNTPGGYLQSIDSTLENNKGETGRKIEEVIADDNNDFDEMFKEYRPSTGMQDSVMRAYLLDYYSDDTRADGFSKMAEKQANKIIDTVMKKKGYKESQREKVLDALIRIEYNKLVNKIKEFTRTQVAAIFDKIAIAEMKAKLPKASEILEAEKSKEETKVSRKTLRDTLYHNISRLKGELKGKDWKNIPDNIKVAFDENRNLKKGYVSTLSDDALSSLAYEIGDYVSDYKITERTKKTYSETIRDRNKRYKEEIQELRRRLKKVKDRNKTLKIMVNEGKSKSEVKIVSETEVPSSLKTILETEYSGFAKSKGYLASEFDQVFKTDQGKFYERNGDVLSKLTQEDIDNIITYYETAVPVGTEVQVTTFKAYKMFILAYIKGEYDRGGMSYRLTYQQSNSIKEMINAIGITSGKLLGHLSKVYDEIDPRRQVLKKMAESTGVEFTDSDIIPLEEAVTSGDVNAIHNAVRMLYEKGTTGPNARINKRSLLDKISTFHRALMLSSLGTAIRNQFSNAILTGANTAGEKIGNFLVKSMSKLTKKTPKNSVQIERVSGDGKYTLEFVDFQGINVTDETKKLVNDEFVESGILDLVSDGLTKYDESGRRKSKYSSNFVDAVVETVKNNVQNLSPNTHSKDWKKRWFGNNQIFKGTNQFTRATSKFANSFMSLVFKLQSDDTWIRRKAIDYVSKLVQMQINKDGTINKDLMFRFLAEAYKLAAYEYVHRPNFIGYMESKFLERFPKLFFVYKILFPFMPSAYNWFKEALNLSPLGLIKSIYNLITIEKRAQQWEKLKERGDSLPSTRFLRHIYIQQLGKGVIVSITFAIGALLAGFGVIGAEPEDDKIYIYIPGTELKIDITGLTGSSSLLTGAALMQGFNSNYNSKGDKTFFDIFGLAANTMLEDFVLTDFVNMFRYNDTVWDFVEYKAFSVLNSFIPNIVKQISRWATVYDIKYEPGILGQLQRFVGSAVPGLANVFSKNIDPYTGNSLMLSGWDITFNIVNSFLPVKFSKESYFSDQELEAISQGISKGMLTGKYEDIGQLDITTLNQIYGQLNEKDLKALMNNEVKVKLKDETGKYKMYYYKDIPTSEMKKNAINNIMSNNAKYAKIITWTQQNEGKYYASSTEYKELAQMGYTKNIYRENNKQKGFVI